MEEQKNSEDISAVAEESGSKQSKKLNEENFLNDQYRLRGRHAYEARRLVQASIDLLMKTGQRKIRKQIQFTNSASWTSR